MKGGRAERAGVQVGDIVLEVSAVTLTAGKEGLYAQNGYGDRPFDNFNRSMMDCVGQDFDTVMNVRPCRARSLPRCAQCPRRSRAGSSPSPTQLCIL